MKSYSTFRSRLFYNITTPKIFQLNVSVHSPFNSFIQVIAVWDIFLEAIQDGFVLVFCSLQRRISHRVEGCYSSITMWYYAMYHGVVFAIYISCLVFSLLTSYELLPASKIVDNVIIIIEIMKIHRWNCINLMVNVDILIKSYEITSRKIFSLVLIAWSKLSVTIRIRTNTLHG